MALLNHSYKVEASLDKLGRPRNEVYFGVEVEVEVGDEGYNNDNTLHKQIISTLGEDFVKLKDDGSLDNGIEIVTTPASLLVHRRRWEKFYQKYNYKQDIIFTDTSCGMHVHFSKGPLSKCDRYRIHKFVNAKENVDFITTMAGREIGEDAQYARRVAKSEEEVESYFPEGKYEALNLTPPNTCELRIFASPETYERFMANLQFTAVMTHYVKASPSTNMTPARLRDFGEKYPKIYDHWLKFCDEEVG